MEIGPIWGSSSLTPLSSLDHVRKRSLMLSRLSSFSKRRNIAHKDDLFVDVMGDGKAVVTGAGVGTVVITGAGVGTVVITGAGVGTVVITGAGVGTVVITEAGVVVLLLPSSEGIKKHQTYSREWILYKICISFSDEISFFCQTVKTITSNVLIGP